MVRHNNSIPKAHFRKKWKLNLKTGFDQPFKKNKRYQRRKKNDKLYSPLSNIPGNFLRPLVHSPTKLNNMRIKIGRGFSMKELSKVKISKKDALSLGISFDKRRRSKNLSEEFNFQRILAFLKRAVFQKKKNNRAVFKKRENLFPFKNNFIKDSSKDEKRIFHPETLPGQNGIRVQAFKELKERKTT
mmetsp:Transcript_4958/g.11988  ORF Transcript_4958/g.11988 Transcript_4958/m.11988 type:complete len:187 (-) Transcript_4958:1605-2165(-)